MSSDTIDTLQLGSIVSQLPLAMMFVVALLLRRSLGSWPPYIAAMTVGLIAVLALHQPDGAEPQMAGALILGLTCGFAPTALFVLARRQLIPGLRRGVMTADERQRWITRNALANTPFRDERSDLRLAQRRSNPR